MTVDPVARAIQTAQECLGRLERDHRTVTANMAAGMIPVRTSLTASSDPDGNVTWTSVEAAGNLRIHTKVGEYQTLIERALVNLLEADLLRGLNVTANTVPLVERDRCTGGAGDWANPSCERIAVVSRWIEGTNHGLCYACDQARYRAGIAR